MASALDTARATIESRIETLWVEADGDARTAIHWANTAFDPPAGDQSWIQPRIVWGNAQEMTKDGRNTVAGVLFVNIYTPRNAGTGAAWTFADLVRDMFNRARPTGVTFFAPSGPTFVPGGDGERWAQWSVSCPFTVEETGL